MKVKGFCPSSFSIARTWLFFPTSLVQRMIFAPLCFCQASTSLCLSYLCVSATNYHRLGDTYRGLTVPKAGTWRWVGRYLPKAFILVNFCVALTKEFIPFMFCQVRNLSSECTCGHTDIEYHWMEAVDERDVPWQDQRQE